MSATQHRHFCGGGGLSARYNPEEHDDDVRASGERGHLHDIVRLFQTHHEQRWRQGAVQRRLRQLRSSRWQVLSQCTCGNTGRLHTANLACAGGSAMVLVIYDELKHALFGDSGGKSGGH